MLLSFASNAVQVRSLHWSYPTISTVVFISDEAVFRLQLPMAILLSLRLHYVNELWIKWTKKEAQFKKLKSEWIQSARQRNRSQVTSDPWDETIDCWEVITSTVCLLSDYQWGQRISVVLSSIELWPDCDIATMLPPPHHKHTEAWTQHTSIKAHFCTSIYLWLSASKNWSQKKK